MATRQKAVIESRNGEKFSPITITKNVLTDDGQNLHDILSDRKEDMMTPIIENSSSMFKAGQGDNVDYSSNVINSAYESMVLKGKTMVNCIQESSSQDVVLPYEFEEGRYVTINDTKESGVLGVELKGQTLVNATGEPIVNLVINSSSPKYLNKNILKKDTVYTFIYDIEEVTGGASGSWGRFNYTDGTYKNVLDKQYTTGITKVATSFNKDLNNLYICWIRSHVEGQSVKLRSLMILEGDWTNKELPPYFTGMTSCKMPILHTVGKNLFNHVPESLIGKTSYGMNVSISNGKIKITGTPTGTYGYVEIVNCVEKGKQYTFSAYENGQLATSGYRLWVRYSDGTLSNPASGGTFVVKNLDIVRVEFVFEGFTVGTAVNKEVNIQIEESSTQTPYEPYKSSILSLPEEVELRKVGDIEDTLNCNTGEYVQRIKEVVFNGSEYWTYSGDHVSNEEYVVYHAKITDPINSSNLGVANNLPYDVEAISTTKFTKECVYINSTYQVCYVRIKRERNGIIDYLTSNPLTVQYQLATPIVTKINLSSTLKSWNTTTHIYSEIPENSLYPILSHLNPTYPVILEPSTKYSIVANSYSNGHTNSTINFNLGGATASTTVGNRVTTITTPSTLSNELLTMSGRGNKLNNVMVIEGDVVGDEPYFEGICDCKSPILSNIGKNLFDLETAMIGSFTINAECSLLSPTSFKVKSRNSGTYQCVRFFQKVKPNTTYRLRADTQTISGNAYVDVYDSNGYLSGSTFNSGNNTRVELRFYCNTNATRDGEVVFSNVRLYEGASSEEDYEPYKSNILSANGDKIELTEDMFEQGTFSTSQTGATYESVKENNNTRIRSKKLIRVKPSTTYCFKFDSSCQMLIGGYDSNQKSLGSKFSYTWLNEKVFTTPANGHYISIAIRKGSGSSNITPSEFNSTGLAIWEVDKTIVLRSLPDGTCDTLNVETGEYVQRIGEVTLDGTKRFGRNMPESEYNKPCVRVSCGSLLVNGSNAPHFNMKADKIAIGQYSYDMNYPVMAGLYEQALYIYIPRTIIGLAANDNDVESIANTFNSWLTQNPITVQYPLATPIVSTVDIQGFPYAYTNGHVQLSSGSIEQSLTPKVEYSVATNRNGQIRSNQKMVERHQKQLDRLQAMILTNLVNTQYEQTLTNLKYDLKNVREEVK